MNEGKQSGESAKRHVPELDGVRGIAIAGVMLVHFVGVLPADGGIQRLLTKVSSYGVWGVDLFFVLSGFLITGILHDARGQSRYFTNFYMRRSLRIFPLYYGVLALIMLGTLLGGARAIPELKDISAVQGWLWTYTVNYYLPTTGDFSIPYVSHFWSLAVEEQFYLVWPFLVGTLSGRQVMRAALALSAIALGLRITLPMLGYNELWAGLPTPCRLDALCIGGWIALAMREESAAKNLLRARLLAVVSAALLFASLMWNALLGTYPAVVLGLRTTLLAVFFGALIALMVSDDGPAAIKATCRMAWLRWLGKYSYGLYVYHGIISWHFFHNQVFESLTERFDSVWLGLLSSATLGIGLSILVSVLSYHFYEAYFLKLKRFFDYRLKKRGDASEAQPATQSAE